MIARLLVGRNRISRALIAPRAPRDTVSRPE
jgi:hypothetical protein